MGNTVQWDNPERTILRRTLSAPWSFDDIRTTTPEYVRMVQENNRPIGVIVHLTEPLYIPTDALVQYQRQTRSRPRQVIITVFVVRQTPAVATLFKMVERIANSPKHRVHLVGTLDEARAVIQQHLATC